MSMYCLARKHINYGRNQKVPILKGEKQSLRQNVRMQLNWRQNRITTIISTNNKPLYNCYGIDKSYCCVVVPFWIVACVYRLSLSLCLRIWSFAALKCTRIHCWFDKHGVTKCFSPLDVRLFLGNCASIKFLLNGPVIILLDVTTTNVNILVGFFSLSLSLTISLTNEQFQICLRMVAFG